MLTLSVSDERGEEVIKNQIKEFKSGLKKEIDTISDLNKFETCLISWIVSNSVNQTISVVRHKRILGYNTKDLENINSVPKKSEHDLVEHSKKFKHLIFKLEYKPNDPYKAWVKYYKNGQIQVSNVKLVIDKFDEEKLA